jgi:hypothetical protein
MSPWTERRPGVLEIERADGRKRTPTLRRVAPVEPRFLHSQRNVAIRPNELECDQISTFAGSSNVQDDVRSRRGLTRSPMDAPQPGKPGGPQTGRPGRVAENRRQPCFRYRRWPAWHNLAHWRRCPGPTSLVGSRFTRHCRGTTSPRASGSAEIADSRSEKERLPKRTGSGCHSVAVRPKLGGSDRD